MSITIDAVLTADVEDPYKCLLIGQGHSEFVSGVARRRVQNTLRTACGKLTLTEIINEKEQLTKRIMVRLLCRFHVYFSKNARK